MTRYPYLGIEYRLGCEPHLAEASAQRTAAHAAARRGKHRWYVGEVGAYWAVLPADEDVGPDDLDHVYAMCTSAHDAKAICARLRKAAR